MTYTDKDLERAWEALRNTPGCTVGIARVAAQLIDNVRRETVEECARVADRQCGRDCDCTAADIRALLEDK